MTPPAAILDIDGTLVDTNYQHALAWYRALRRHGATVPLWKLHRHIGMGGDQFVGAVAGEEFDSEHGDAARETEGEMYQEFIDEVQPLPGARELVEELRERGCRVILASSAKEHEAERYVELIGAGDIEFTTSADVEETKPSPDIVLTAKERIGGGPAIMVGDSVWDCEAANRAGVRCFGLLTGGFSEAELKEAGAEAVYESLGDLKADLDRVLGAA